MSSDKQKHLEEEAFRKQAAAWVCRRDRGLTRMEQDDLSKWLGDDHRHRDAYRKAAGHWHRLDQLGQWLPEHSSEPNPALLAPPLRKRLVRPMPVAGALALAAALAVCFSVWRGPHRPSQAAAGLQIEAPQGLTSRVLEDGSIVELNSGAAISTHFTAGERRIRLERGEAYFTVAKNPQRPFVVVANGVDVLALGTAFNVRMDAAVVEVLVTEGVVDLKPTTIRSERATGEQSQPPARPLVPALHAQQRAIVAVDRHSGPPQIANLTPGEVERVVGWHHQLLNFSSAPLSEIVAEFNRHNRTQVVITDREIADVRISAKFRSDNLDAFVRLLESGFDVQVEYVGENEIRLRKSQ